MKVWLAILQAILGYQLLNAMGCVHFCHSWAALIMFELGPYIFTWAQRWCLSGPILVLLSCSFPGRHSFQHISPAKSLMHAHTILILIFFLWNARFWCANSSSRMPLVRRMFVSTRARSTGGRRRLKHGGVAQIKPPFLVRGLIFERQPMLNSIKHVFMYAFIHPIKYLILELWLGFMQK